MPSQRRARIVYSQNFLTDRALVRQLLAQARLEAGDLVYEIGPGSGLITGELARLGCRVVAVERDPMLAKRLAEKTLHWPSVSPHLADFLRFPLPAWPYKVVANPPFSISAALITRLFVDSSGPDDAYLVLQRETALRVLGQPRETLFGLMIRPWFEPDVVHAFRRRDFFPEPGVDVVLLRLRKRGPPLVAHDRAAPFRDFVTFAFTHARPTLISALRRALPAPVVQQLGVPRALTCGEVSLESWVELFNRLDESQLSAAIGANAHLRKQQSGLVKQYRSRVRL